MYLKYEGADFKVGLRRGSIERHLMKQSIKKRIGKWIGKPYRMDPYLKFASEILSSSQEGIIVDIGANVGTTVLPLAVKFPSAKFYAIEPHPVPAARFIENCEHNRVNNVTLLTAAIGPETKLAQIYTCPTNSGGHRLTGFKGRRDVERLLSFGPIEIPMQPLDEVFNEFGIKHCTLLKVDTEGYEVFVLQSLKDKLIPGIINHIVAELGPEGLRQAGFSSWDLISMMLSRGYVCRILGTDHWIEQEGQIPALPDFSVLDVIFSPSTKGLPKGKPLSEEQQVWVKKIQS